MATLTDVQVGDELGEKRINVQRINLVMYAGASGDFNPIHWNERFAKVVGLPDVIAHGMYTMAQVGRVLSNHAGDPAGVVDYSVRFTKPVVVPDDDKGATIVVNGTVVEKDDSAGTVTVDIHATSGEDEVLGKARAVLRLAS